jgi:hypothetical protein
MLSRFLKAICSISLRFALANQRIPRIQFDFTPSQYRLWVAKKRIPPSLTILATSLNEFVQNNWSWDEDSIDKVGCFTYPEPTWKVDLPLAKPVSSYSDNK